MSMMHAKQAKVMAVTNRCRMEMEGQEVNGVTIALDGPYGDMRIVGTRGKGNAGMLDVMRAAHKILGAAIEDMKKHSGQDWPDGHITDMVIPPIPHGKN